MPRDTDKRTFLHLNSVQGERLSLCFDIQDLDTEEFLDLSEYDLVGSIVEDYVNAAVETFTFQVDDEDDNLWEAFILGADTTPLVPKTYQYEIRMTHKTEGEPETLFYGTWELLPTRLGAAP